MDVMATWIVLYKGGHELNYLAWLVIDRWELPGLLVYKFFLVSLIIVIIEVIGRAKYRTGKRLSYFAVFITSIPVAVAFIQLLIVVYARSSHGT